MGRSGPGARVPVSGGLTKVRRRVHSIAASAPKQPPLNHIRGSAISHAHIVAHWEEVAEPVGERRGGSVSVYTIRFADLALGVGIRLALGMRQKREGCFGESCGRSLRHRLCRISEQLGI